MRARTQAKAKHGLALNALAVASLLLSELRTATETLPSEKMGLVSFGLTHGLPPPPIVGERLRAGGDRIIVRCGVAGGLSRLC